ncbi:MAG: DUF4912 domain-containing protein [Methylococcaceae bacterium]
MKFSNSKYKPQSMISTEEMLQISQEINLAFTPIFSIEIAAPACQYPLSSKEMLQISEEISLDFAPGVSNNTQKLVLLPVDPNHLYAYWNLGDAPSGSTQKTDPGHPLTLRIYSEPDNLADALKKKPYFDVAVDGTQAKKHIDLPWHTHQTSYSATLDNRYQNDNQAPLASSNITHVPLGKVMPHPDKARLIGVKSTPQSVIASLGTSFYKNNSASGQRINQ